ncbi:winged helix-turn-helix transcriptional regulator [Nocardia halotolerans]|uniref:Winged helix-turn-helix transcriptional regulator n=1 Tax=Nocardia halotolerans TaxID=1755878 RepID=A0ABV8VQQ6_9NOCA
MKQRERPYSCGIDAALDVVGGKWKALILWALSTGTQRFGNLKRLVPGVTEKMLIQQLRELEHDGIISREVYAQVPPKVEYALTERGASLNAALVMLGEWGRDNMQHICEVKGVDAPVH